MVNYLKYHITSLKDFPSYEPSERSVAVRIGDTYKDLGEAVTGRYERVLDLCFKDLYKRPYLKEEEYFNEEHIKELEDFFQYIQKNNVEELVVHCHAGISRSSSVLIAYLLYEGQYEKVQRLLDLGRYFPNAYVSFKWINHLLHLHNDGKVIIRDLSNFYKCYIRLDDYNKDKKQPFSLMKGNDFYEERWNELYLEKVKERLNMKKQPLLRWKSYK